MEKAKIIILVLTILAGGAGFWFRNDILKIYNNFTLGVQDFKKTDIGIAITDAGKEILTPPPLNIGGVSNKVVLLKDKIISETNLQRQENGGLPELTENSILDEVALAKANDMFKKQYFEHISPAGVGPAKLVESFGYQYIATGENLILGNFKDEKELVQAWMDSPGHRANILNNRYTEIGVAIIKGIYEGKTAWIGVQEFGLPLATCEQVDESLKNEIESNNSQLDMLSSQIDQLKGSINNARGQERNQLINEYNGLVEQYNSLSSMTKSEIAQYNEQVNNFNACVAGK